MKSREGVDTNIILFDGVCNLCNGLVKFMFKYDKKAVFSFASLQSETAEILLKKAGLTEVPDSVIVIKEGKALVKSEAALSIIQQLGGFFKLLLVFRLLPRSIRDRLYDEVAKRRYKWFGKQESCMLPTKEQRKRFL
ncbi:thiol-disulfide oxidoreductase DCC family protein [Bacillus sp. RAR_GA_16]|uniref:thiol-disulfide oxidoreductase DCC family protein n=1 Tax=Bacillus sp. RAR_GA_16 TaxID=2876774 RepID=UPI001CCEA25C|nr:thiol-disulfide oxidoreductase DCC family protein [Bacillus sp. RAR_GA_16]MCA0174059.1 thiol-disulfide oxidoreductase DCC family protein [Bacillus sp. RAR_GA_16]